MSISSGISSNIRDDEMRDLKKCSTLELMVVRAMMVMIRRVMMTSRMKTEDREATKGAN